MKRIVMATAMAMLLSAGTAFAEDSTGSQQGQGGSGSMGSSSDEAVGGSGSMSGSSQKSSKSGSAASSAQKGTLTVKEVDQSNNKLTFEAQLAPNAKIMSSSGQKLSLDQIKEGDQVRANFDPKTGDVQRVTVESEQGQGGSGQQGTSGSSKGSKSDSSSQGGSGSQSGSESKSGSGSY